MNVGLPLTLVPPNGGATWVRRIGADERSLLRTNVRGATLDKILKGETQLLDICLRFADLVVIAGWLHPIPFRTRP